MMSMGGTHLGHSAAESRHFWHPPNTDEKRQIIILTSESSRSIGSVLVHVPASEHSVAEELVAEFSQAVAGVCLQGQLHVLVGFASMAFPPVDVADGRKERR